LLLHQLRNPTRSRHPRSAWSSLLELKLKNSFLNFNHFVSTNKGLNLGPDGNTLRGLLLRLLRRHAALQLSHGQPHWDLLIPIYFGELSAPLNPAHLSAIVIQIKNRANKAPFHLGNEFKQYFSTINNLVVYIQLELGTREVGIAIAVRWPSQMSEPELSHQDTIQPGKELLVLGVSCSSSSARNTFGCLDKLGLLTTFEALLAKSASFRAGTIEDVICQKMVAFNDHGCGIEGVWRWVMGNK